MIQQFISLRTTKHRQARNPAVLASRANAQSGYFARLPLYQLCTTLQNTRSLVRRLLCVVANYIIGSDLLIKQKPMLTWDRWCVQSAYEEDRLPHINLSLGQPV